MVLSREQCALGVALLQGRYLERLTKYQHRYFGLKNDFFPTIAWTHVHTCLGFPDLAPELRVGLCVGIPQDTCCRAPCLWGRALRGGSQNRAPKWATPAESMAVAAAAAGCCVGLV